MKEDMLFGLSLMGKFISVFLGISLLCYFYVSLWKKTLFQLDDLETKKFSMDAYGRSYKPDVYNILALLFVALHFIAAIGYLIWSWLY